MKPRKGLRATLGSSGLTIFLLCVILVLSFVATVIPQDSTSRVAIETLYSPEVVYGLRLSGVTDIFHSGWFIFVLFALAVNLICGALERFPAIWKQAEDPFPPLLNVEQVLHGNKNAERYRRAEFKSAIGREEFRGLIGDWARARIGRPRALKDDGGLNELQLAVQQGRLSRVVLPVAQVGLALFAIGLFLSWRGSFEGSLVVNEGGRAAFMQIVHGTPPGRWKSLQENGRSLPDFVIPDFEVAATHVDSKDYPGTQIPMSTQTSAEFYEQGVRVAQKTLSPNHPAWFHGLLFMQGQAKRSGRSGAGLLVTDEETHTPRKLGHLSVGAVYDGGGFSVRVLEIQQNPELDEGQSAPKGDGYGPAVHLELTEGKQAPERFWVFMNFPEFDAVHRRRSRFHFSVLDLAPEMTSELHVYRDPGVFVALAGLLIALLAFGYSLVFGFNRFWFVWYPGRVALLGWSHRFQIFEPRFDRAVAQIRTRIQKIEKAKSEA